LLQAIQRRKQDPCGIIILRRNINEWLLAGPVVYLIARVVRRSSSIDLDLAMRELPPE